MSSKEQEKRPIRIVSVSGAMLDRLEGMTSFLQDSGPIDAIMGDWLSEINLATLAMEKEEDPSKGYESIFLEYFKHIAKEVAQKKIKVVSNAGGLNPSALAQALRLLLEQQGIHLTVVHIEGDNLLPDLDKLKQSGNEFYNIDTGKPLSSFGLEPIAANAYLGGWGITSALNAGADIVICGRITDASAVTALSAWWHHWKEDNFNALAGALIAGHLIECSTYVTGGNFCGFKQLKSLVNIGHPIAEIAFDGTTIITKVDNTDGLVSRETVISQLVYEIQGPFYANPDVVAFLPDIQIEDIGENRVKVTEVKGFPPPKTAKMGICAVGGYAAEMHWYPTGLDLKEKVEMLKQQALHYLKPEKFSSLVFDVYGTVASNPKSLKESMVHLRIFAQSKEKENLEPKNFLYPIINNALQSYPGAQWNPDLRLAHPRKYIEYWPTLIDTSYINEKVVFENGKTIDIPKAKITADFKQYSQEPGEKFNPSKWGETTEAPLGNIVYARSGDKFINCNVGLFVHNKEQWPWLSSFLTTEKLRELLGDDDTGGVIERFEFPHLWAVHFLLKGHLKAGVASSSSYDCLGKNVAEYLRCKIVQVPKKFLK